jgi:hypothetical protein
VAVEDQLAAEQRELGREVQPQIVAQLDDRRLPLVDQLGSEIRMLPVLEWAGDSVHPTADTCPGLEHGDVDISPLQPCRSTQSSKTSTND